MCSLSNFPGKGRVSCSACTETKAGSIIMCRKIPLKPAS